MAMSPRTLAYFSKPTPKSRGLSDGKKLIWDSLSRDERDEFTQKAIRMGWLEETPEIQKKPEIPKKPEIVLSPYPLPKIIAKDFTVRMTPITKEECKSGQKFYFVIGENFSDDDGDYTKFYETYYDTIKWTDNPLYNEGTPGPVMDGSELTAFDPCTGLYQRYPVWAEHCGLILLPKKK